MYLKEDGGLRELLHGQVPGQVGLKTSRLGPKQPVGPSISPG